MTEPRILHELGAELRIFGDDASLFVDAADEFLRAVTAALASRGACDIALAGGSTPRKLYSLVAARAGAIDWPRVHFFFGDERCVPPDHVESNYRMAHESLFASPALARAHLHRMKGELSPADAAREYEQELRGHFGPQLPRFDLVLLGMGPDGHTASLFPATDALEQRDRWVVANWVEKFGMFRLTLTYPVLNHASEVMFLVAGAEKRDAVRRIFRQGEPLPAAGVRPAGKLLWLLDAPAASGLQ